MSEEVEEESVEPTTNVLDSIKSFLEDLVPPKSITIVDIFGTEYNLVSAISARNQIKVLREFDKIEDIKGIEFNDEDNILQTIIKVASNEEYLKVLCSCFEIAHKKVLLKAKQKADEVDCDYEEGDFLAADLFSIEELASAIIPLFIRLAKRTSQAIQKLTI